MDENKIRDINIRDAACIALGLLTASATSPVEKERNKNRAAQVILRAIQGNGVPENVLSGSIYFSAANYSENAMNSSVSARKGSEKKDAANDHRRNRN